MIPAEAPTCMGFGFTPEIVLIVIRGPWSNSSSSLNCNQNRQSPEILILLVSAQILAYLYVRGSPSQIGFIA
jgi:hypothetical protein